MTEKKIFSCLECGKPFEVYPPDDFHPDASRKKEELYEDVIKIEYTPKCGHKNTLYWGNKKFVGAVIS